MKPSGPTRLHWCSPVGAAYNLHRSRSRLEKWKLGKFRERLPLHQPLHSTASSHPKDGAKQNHNTFPLMPSDELSTFSRDSVPPIDKEQVRIRGQPFSDATLSSASALERLASDKSGVERISTHGSREESDAFFRLSQSENGPVASQAETYPSEIGKEKTVPLAMNAPMSLELRKSLLEYPLETIRKLLSEDRELNRFDMFLIFIHIICSYYNSILCLCLCLSFPCIFSVGDLMR